MTTDSLSQRRPRSADDLARDDLAYDQFRASFEPFAEMSDSDLADYGSKLGIYVHNGSTIDGIPYMMAVRSCLRQVWAEIDRRNA
jgi:hypothetical protein